MFGFKLTHDSKTGPLEGKMYMIKNHKMDKMSHFHLLITTELCVYLLWHTLDFHFFVLLVVHQFE